MKELIKNNCLRKIIILEKIHQDKTITKKNEIVFSNVSQEKNNVNTNNPKTIAQLQIYSYTPEDDLEKTCIVILNLMMIILIYLN